jgi:hypothetical protein
MRPWARAGLVKMESSRGGVIKWMGKSWGSPGEMGAIPILQSYRILCHWPILPPSQPALKMLWLPLVVSLFSALIQAAPTDSSWGTGAEIWETGIVANINNA